MCVYVYVGYMLGVCVLDVNVVGLVVVLVLDGVVCVWDAKTGETSAAMESASGESWGVKFDLSLGLMLFVIGGGML